MKVEALPAPPIPQGAHVPATHEFNSILVMLGADWIRELIDRGEFIIAEDGELHMRKESNGE